MFYKKIFIILIVLAILCSGCDYNRTTDDDFEPYFSEVLTEREVRILQRRVTIFRLEQVVGRIDSLESHGSGIIVFAANSERFGEIAIFPDEAGIFIGEIYQCVVINDGEPYLLFCKQESLFYNRMLSKEELEE